MNKYREIAFESVFDIIEFKYGDQKIFAWQPISNDPLAGAPLMEMDLYSPYNATYDQAHYKFLPFTILKVTLKETLQLRITNARISKLTDTKSQLFGFKLCGYKNTVALFTNSLESYPSIYKLVKFYCIQSQLTNEYNIQGLLGRGNFSKVHLGCKLGISEKYAIKSIAKDKILKSMHSMVT